jgi:hypothetical protein
MGGQRPVYPMGLRIINDNDHEQYRNTYKENSDKSIFHVFVL